MSSEKGYDWKPLKSPTFGDIFRPIVPIEVRSMSGEWKVFYPEVDSGAIISVFNRCDCELLGFTLMDGTYFELRGVLGGSTPAYIHTVKMKIGGEMIESRIAFTDGKNHKHLLGRIDVFDKFRIALSGKYLKTTILRE